MKRELKGERKPYPDLGIYNGGCEYPTSMILFLGKALHKDENKSKTEEGGHLKEPKTFCWIQNRGGEGPQTREKYESEGKGARYRWIERGWELQTD